MHYEDAIYGKVLIGEPLVQELMATKAMQRLQGVLQHGVSALIGITSPITRFEHSVGTMLLAHRLGATLVEQVAALLHDVSHTALSHVIDYVYDNHGGQNYHDLHKEFYLANSDIPPVMARHGLRWQDLLDEGQFPILEQPAPHLCADRLDYFLRDSIELDLAGPHHIRLVLDHLVVAGGRLATDSLEVARWLADTYMRADEASWANFREVGIYELTAQAIRRGLEVGALSEADIWSTDRPLWEKLLAHGDGQLQSTMRLISPHTRFAWDEEKPTFRVSTKLRTIDPGVLRGNYVVPLSELDPGFAARRHAYLERKSGRWPMRVLPHKQ